MKNYNSIVAPLKKIEKSLKAYANAQYRKKMKIKKAQVDLDEQIDKIIREINKSDITSAKISKLLDTTKK